MDYNFHPALSSLPAAFLTAVVVCELLSLRKDSPTLRALAFGNLWFAAVGYLLAFFSGYQGLDYANQTFTVPEELIDTHHTIGRVGLFMVWPLLALRVVAGRARENQPVVWTLYRILLVATYTVTIYTSFLGGGLVFKHGAGVSAQPQQPGLP